MRDNGDGTFTFEWMPGSVEMISRPVVFVEGYPPLPDETTDQYVARVMPMLSDDLDATRPEA